MPAAPTSGPVPRPLFAGDVQPGMRIFASSGFAGSFGPATVLPDGLVELGGGMVAVKAMTDDGLVGVVTLPACQAIVELVDPPPVHLTCECGADDCTGQVTILYDLARLPERHPHRLAARVINANRQIFGLTAAKLDSFSLTNGCGGEDCCPTRLDNELDRSDDKPLDCSDRPEPTTGYL
jgi:hypothetical protein